MGKDFRLLSEGSGGGGGDACVVMLISDGVGLRAAILELGSPVGATGRFLLSIELGVVDVEGEFEPISGVAGGLLQVVVAYVVVLKRLGGSSWRCICSRSARNLLSI